MANTVRARSSSTTRCLATWKSHVGELAPPVEARQRLVDAHEHLLTDVLGERPVAGEHARHVVEDRPVVLPDDDRKRPLVASTSESQDIGIWLRKGRISSRCEKPA